MSVPIEVPDFADIKLKKQSASPRYIVESLLMDPKVFGAIKPFVINGGVCGHKVMDIKAAVDELKRADVKVNGDSALNRFGLNDFQLGNVLKQVLRQRYELDKQWKIADVNRRLTAQADKS